MVFKFKKIIAEKNQQNESDSPIFFPLIEIDDGNFYLSFKNGMTVVINCVSAINSQVRIFTPTHNITNRFKTKFNVDYIYSPEELLELLNIVVKFPNVYTVNKIPDSCFDFERRDSDI